MRSVLIRAMLFTFFLTSNSKTFAESQEQFIAGAKKEGNLVVYASATAQQLQMYFAAFNKKYPFIKTEFFRTGKQKLVSKILFEEQAKQHIADIIHTSVIETNILKKRGVLSSMFQTKPPPILASTKIPTVTGPPPMPAARFWDSTVAR